MQSRSWLCVVAVSVAVSLSPPAFSQTPAASGPQQCAALSTLADQHESRSQSILKSIETDTRNKPADEVARIMQDRSNTSASEQQLASLARDAYRKCLTDYLGGGVQQQPAAVPQQQYAPPAQQAVPEQPPVQQPPVQQVQPAPVQQAPAQQARPVQRQQQQRVYRQPQQQQQQQQQPGIIISPGGLIDLGIGIGLGRHRDR